MREIDIIEKINELFEYRGIHELAVRLGEIESGFYDLLVELQYSIFLYDKCLEQNEYPNFKELSMLWIDIENAMVALGRSREESATWLSEIRTYARNELSMRDGVRMSSLPISYFYFYKSCDIRLMRRLLFKKAGTNASLIEDSQWFVFDWVTEINDDVSDVEEDWNTYNGNRFLQSCREVGYAPTSNEYQSFLTSLSQKMVKSAVRSADQAQLQGRTEMEIKQTMELIEEMKAVFAPASLRPI